MASKHQPPIAREGWPFIAVAVALALAAHLALGPWPAAIFWLLGLALLYLFRDPPRRLPPSSRSVLSPADGWVVELGRAHDPWLDREAVRLRLVMEPVGVFSIRSPVGGKVLKRWYPWERGRGTAQDSLYAQWLRTDSDEDVLLAIKPARRRRQFCYPQSGDRVGQGQRCGYIPFGTELDIFMPPNVRLAVQAGERVRSGVAVLATLVTNR